MSLTLTFIALLSITGVIYIACISSYFAPSINTYRHFLLQKVAQPQHRTAMFSMFLLALFATIAPFALPQGAEYRYAVQECDANEA